MNEPELRFKDDDGSEFPEWEIKKVDSLIEDYSEKYDGKEDIPVLTSSREGLMPQQEHFGRKQIHDITDYNVIPKGYCTYRNRSDDGLFKFNTNQNITRGIVSKFYPVFRCMENTDFLIDYLNNNVTTKKQLSIVSVGTSQTVLSNKAFHNLNIFCPCIEEQQKIAGLFSTLDNVINSIQEEVDSWEQMKRGVMQNLFSQEVRFKANDGTDFPEWEEKKLESFCDVITKQTGFDYTATIKPSLSNQHLENTLPYLQTKNFGGINFDYNTDFYIPIEIAEQFPKIILDRVCVLFSIVGASVGNVALFPATVKCFLSGAICVAKPVRETDAKYIYYYMESAKGQKQIYEKTKGGAQATITIEDIRNFTIDIPEKDEEEQKIVDCLSEFDSVIEKTKQKLEAYKQLKKGLMQRMFV